MTTSDRLPPVIQQRWKSHRQLFRPDWGSSVWRTDGWWTIAPLFCVDVLSEALTYGTHARSFNLFGWWWLVSSIKLSHIWNFAWSTLVWLITWPSFHFGCSKSTTVLLCSLQDFSATDMRGWTPAHHAAYHGQLRTLLVSRVYCLQLPWQRTGWVFSVMLSISKWPPLMWQATNGLGHVTPFTIRQPFLNQLRHNLNN